MALFTVIREGDKFRVILPTNRLQSLPDSAKGRLEKYDTFLINENELAGSSNLSTDSPLRYVLAGLGSAALTMYAAPHTLRSGEFQAAADSFAFQFAQAFPQVPIFRDYYTKDTNPRTLAMATRKFGAPDKYVFLRASNETGVKDLGIINNIIQPRFADLSIPILTYDGSNAATLGKQLGGKDLGIIVVTAHSAESLQKMIYDLSDSGAFEGNVVVFVSCRTAVTRGLTEYMGGKGAKGVVVFDRAITYNDARAMFPKLHDLFQQLGSADLPFRKAIRDAFSAVVNIISVSQNRARGEVLKYD
jgi:hypothetical protein